MTAIAINKIESSIEQSLLIDRFILAQVANTTLVFPATWVAEILRVDRSHVLTLPFYNRFLLGVIDLNGQTIPLLNTADLLKLTQVNLPERIVVIRLNRVEEGLSNVGLIIDRSIGTATRQELPPDLFTTHRAGELVMMRSTLIPIDSWQPQY
jgi:chemotaxis signal transduction protein